MSGPGSEGFTEHKRLASDFVVDPVLVVNIGDVLVSRASGSAHLVGSVGRITALKYRLILSDKTFRPLFTEGVDPDFLVLAMNGRYYRQQVARAISGAEGLANNLPLSSLRAFYFAIPTIDEQRDVVRYVTNSTDKLDGASNWAQRQASLVDEYRACLIADVVPASSTCEGWWPHHRRSISMGTTMPTVPGTPARNRISIHSTRQR